VVHHLARAAMEVPPWEELDTAVAAAEDAVRMYLRDAAAMLHSARATATAATVASEAACHAAQAADAREAQHLAVARKAESEGEGSQRRPPPPPLFS